ncbi:MAG: DUF1330 domain-containing protein [Alphaproteobacteria bacterium]|nr:DUF1330 domain-containing protein [Alphaproteobacteria bacterium]
MSAYAIAIADDIRDLDKYLQWAQRAAASLNRTKAKQIARSGSLDIKALDGKSIPPSGRIAAVDGDPTIPKRISVMEFPTYEDALAWYQSKEFQDLKAFRGDAARIRVLLVEGAD